MTVSYITYLLNFGYDPVIKFNQTWGTCFCELVRVFTVFDIFLSVYMRSSKSVEELEGLLLSKEELEKLHSDHKLSAKEEAAKWGGNIPKKHFFLLGDNKWPLVTLT